MDFLEIITIFELASTSSKRVTLVPIFLEKSVTRSTVPPLPQKTPAALPKKKTFAPFSLGFSFLLAYHFFAVMRLRRIFPIRDYFNLIRLLRIAIGFVAVILLEKIMRNFLALSFILFYKKSYLLYLRTCLPDAHGVFMRYCYFLHAVSLRWDLLQFWSSLLVGFFTSRGALRPLSHLFLM